jgi:hypothetical protein
MSFSLSVTDRAAREIAAARAEYAQHGKAADFMASVDHVFERLFEHPACIRLSMTRCTARC